MAKVVILGAGVMGSAMAVVAADRGHSVSLVGTHLDEPVISSLEATHLHPKLGLTLASTVTVYRWDRFGEVLKGGIRAKKRARSFRNCSVPTSVAAKRVFLDYEHEHEHDF
jgi:3-hydroxyacyl-CoA dehydrogenase